MKKTKKGYSLIELTIVVGLVSMLALAISAIVLATATYSNRIRIKIRLRQIGDYAIGQMQTLIRNSREIVACDSTANTLTIKNQDFQNTSYTLSSARIASSSASTRYLTPSDIDISLYDLNCSPSDTDPSLVNISFRIKNVQTGGERAVEDVYEDFATSIQLRNF